LGLSRSRCGGRVDCAVHEHAGRPSGARAGDRHQHGLFPPITEAWDRPDEPDVALARKARRAITEVVRRGGGDPTFPRELPGHLAASSLADFGAEGYFVPYRTDAVAGLAKANMDQLGDAILDAGLMDAAELERYRVILNRPDCFYPASMALISVWGRRQLA
jgi:hypothetical protein